jgi:hypothetical protein
VRVYELMRKVSVGPLTIRLWIEADCSCCEQSIEHADRISSAVADMADEEDDPMILAEKIADTFIGINAVEVLDEDDNGGLVYPNWP